jgi:hypothetical protein
MGGLLGEIRLSLKPCFMAASVFTEHGATTIPPVEKDPLDSAAPMSPAG